jgi:hypothetical protein
LQARLIVVQGVLGIEIRWVLVVLYDDVLWVDFYSENALHYDQSRLQSPFQCHPSVQLSPPSSAPMSWNPECRTTGYMKAPGSSKEPRKTDSQTSAGKKSSVQLSPPSSAPSSPTFSSPTFSTSCPQTSDYQSFGAPSMKARKMAGRAVHWGGTGTVIASEIDRSARRSRNSV